MLQKELEAIMDSIPLLGDESKRLNFKPYMIDPEPPDPETYMKGQCHIIKYKCQWTTMWSLECQKQLIAKGQRLRTVNVNMKIKELDHLGVYLQIISNQIES